MGKVLPQNPQKESTLPTWWSRTSSLRNCETYITQFTALCYSSPSKHMQHPIHSSTNPEGHGLDKWEMCVGIKVVPRTPLPGLKTLWLKRGPTPAPQQCQPFPMYEMMPLLCSKPFDYFPSHSLKVEIFTDALGGMGVAIPSGSPSFLNSPSLPPLVLRTWTSCWT